MDRPWFQFYDEDVPHSLIFPPLTAPDFLRRSAERHPNQTATVFFGARLTYRQLKQHVDRLAAGLHALGVSRGDRVAILLPNCPQTIIAYYATLSLGAVAVLTNPLYVERELIHQWGDAGVETAIVLEPLWPRVDQVRRQISLKNIVVSGIQDYLPLAKKLLYPIKARRDGSWTPAPDRPGVVRFRHLMRRGGGPPPGNVSPDHQG
ncbi:MAG: AMP-binding protein, partial [Chloroflexota bacterium]